MSKSANQVNHLLKKFKMGDEQSFKELFDLTYCSLLLIALRYIRDEWLAEDAVSDAYVTVYKKIELFDEQKDGFNWLCKIVENKVKDILRAQKSYVCVELYDITTVKDIETAEAHSDLCGLLDKLDDYEYKLIYMKFIEEKTFREIARELGISVSKAERDLYKTINKLKNDKI